MSAEWVGYVSPHAPVEWDREVGALHILTNKRQDDLPAVVTDPAVVAWLDLPRPACPTCDRPLASWGPTDPTLWRCFHCHADWEVSHVHD